MVSVKDNRIKNFVVKLFVATTIATTLFGSVSNAWVSHNGWVEQTSPWNRRAVGQTWRGDEGHNGIYTRARIVANGGIIVRDSGRVLGWGYSKAYSGWGSGSGQTFWNRY